MSQIEPGDVRRIDIEEFRALGFIQEINRLILHPCGLALEVVTDADGKEILGGVWDERDDPEGIYFAGDIDARKAASVRSMMYARAIARQRALGYVIQPAGVELGENQEAPE